MTLPSPKTGTGTQITASRLGGFPHSNRVENSFLGSRRQPSRPDKKALVDQRRLLCRDPSFVSAARIIARRASTVHVHARCPLGGLRCNCAPADGQETSQQDAGKFCVSGQEPRRLARRAPPGRRGSTRRSLLRLRYGAVPCIEKKTSAQTGVLVSQAAKPSGGPGDSSSPATARASARLASFAKRVLAVTAEAGPTRASALWSHQPANPRLSDVPDGRRHVREALLSRAT
jgi:hypothetical protein